MDIVEIGMAFDIAGPLIAIAFIIAGAVKAWPYRKTDAERFRKIYKPYKYWGFGLWLLFNLVGILLVIIA